ncbi:diapophytoene dehydrogenase [Tamlana nanhaiensis]|uniref:Dihydrolipoamide acetyltransferase component of pyruvate dehydrogenase complex n=1 Tax=Neotamlana nanhaiensis TaxID=1382798 RepID=A0A0D7W387_9FLAO|nr:dihydrolipoamide acetyltransferase family protein [Tamlana nanhaiensis]KJD33561.1 diapophytoene dehydrogenase [Tamlana nanhaiensis]
MAKFKLKLPKMGESVAEATITSWLKEIGDTIEIDEPILEIATDKVDSEVPSEVEGVLVERFFNVDDVAQVGEVLAIIETETDVVDSNNDNNEVVTTNSEELPQQEVLSYVEETVAVAQQTVEAPAVISTDNRFYSPLVKNIAKAEGVTQEELDKIPGTGKDARVTKNDILQFLENRNGNGVIAPAKIEPTPVPVKTIQAPVKAQIAPVISNGEDEIIEMTRMGKLVSNHMTSSLQTSAHVQSFIEADVTNIWNWRKKVKDAFMKQEGENLTFTPIFMEAVAKALREYPLMNISVQDDKIIKKKNINLGMAAALPDGNLIVPVIKNADQLNLVGMTKQVNDLANRARLNQLKPDEIQGGTYTVTNVGSFGSIMGTPIINQPQVGILALGAIRKVPAVIETPDGDFIGIRYKMFLSHSYDHRVVNGALGGMFVKAVADYLEAWDTKREI